MRLCLIALLSCSFLPAGEAARAPSPVAPPAPTLTVPTGEYVLAHLRLTGGPQGVECPITVAYRDSKPIQLWAQKPLPGQRGEWIFVDALAGSMKEATFTVRGFNQNAKGGGTQEMLLTIRMQGQASRMTGDWSLSEAGAPLASGKLEGSARTDAELRKADALATGQDWPGFYGPGPDSAFRAAAYGKPITTDLNLARPLWRSEAVSLSGWGTGADARYAGKSASVGLCGGSSSPIVADGVVYLYSYLPSGDVSEAEARSKKGEAIDFAAVKDAVGRETYRRFFSTLADVQVVAMDAATGQTLWRSVWPYKQGNFQTHKWRGFNFTPALADGVLVVADYSWNLYAHDAKTGALLWTRGNSTNIVSDQGNIGPLISKGVVVWTGSGGTVGLDLRSGAERWKAPGARGARNLRLNGKEAVLLSGPTLHAIDPATGAVLAKGSLPTEKQGKDGKPDIGRAAGANLVTHEDWILTFVVGAGQVVALRAQGDAITEVWRSEAKGQMEDGHIGLCVTAAGRVFTAFQDTGSFLIDLATGKTLGSVPEHTAHSNPIFTAMDDWVLSQPECQHGSQAITLFNTAGGALKQMHAPWHPPHNDTTAYGEMPIGNVVVDGRLIVRGIDGVYCYDLRAP
jgi:outer membrane protein assembly factor BamB